MITGVIAPLSAECRTARALRRAGWRVVHAGVGLARAQAAAEALLGMGAQRLLVWGTAGGLAPALRPGCVVLPELVRDAEGRSYVLDAEWREELKGAVAPGLTFTNAAIVSVDSPVVTRTQRHALAESSGAAAVDMETAAVARIAQQHAVPCAAVRAIADPLELELPGVILAARCDRLLPLEIPLRLLLRPNEVPAIRDLSRAFSAARSSLESIAGDLARGIRQA